MDEYATQMCGSVCDMFVALGPCSCSTACSHPCRAGKLKRNTVAFERAVEYGGNIKQLSCDARFAIANMTVGGRSGILC